MPTVRSWPHHLVGTQVEPESTPLLHASEYFHPEGEVSARACGELLLSKTESNLLEEFRKKQAVRDPALIFFFFGNTEIRL